jgi:dTDP-4-amino-4,6-dideoxygalactose transaminase
MAKAPNYTKDQVELMSGMYLGVEEESEERRDEVVEEIADILGKNVRSIRAKLSNLKIYRRKTPVASDGEPVKKKAEWNAELVEVAGVPLTSSENLTREDMKKLVNVIRELRETIAAMELESSTSSEES